MGAKGLQCSICFHVDDLMITSADNDMIEEVIETLKKAYKTISVNKGKTHSYFRLTFDFSNKGTVRITAEGFVEDLINL
jgi:hypothetical protein